MQNAAPIEDLGIATSTSNFFRSMGGAFGAAVAGAFFTARLTTELSDRLGAAQLESLGGVEELIKTPKDVRGFPVELRDAIVGAVSDSVSGMFMQAIPLMAGVLVMALALREIPLRTSSAVGGQDASTSPAATPAGTTPPATVPATHDPAKEL